MTSRLDTIIDKHADEESDADYQRRMDAATPVPCAHCGTAATVSHGFEVSIYCYECYDGTEDAGPRAHIHAHGRTLAKAIEEWKELQEENT